jgi:plasmid stabilization system protein ParE
MTDVVFLLSAEFDIQRAYDFYERFQEGRGDVFMRHLDIVVGRLRSFPESGPVVHTRYRRLLVPSYPYGIFYTIEPRGIIVAGIMDTRQDPEAIARRLC